LSLFIKGHTSEPIGFRKEKHILPGRYHHCQSRTQK
jgi:hypothetical protein